MKPDLDKKKYELICRYAFGCVPLDIEWAIKTKPYLEMSEKIET